MMIWYLSFWQILDECAGTLLHTYIASYIRYETNSTFLCDIAICNHAADVENIKIYI